MNFELGQTYICTYSKYRFWTEGKEYEVISDNEGNLYIEDDDGGKCDSKTYNIYLKHLNLKDKTLINKQQKTIYNLETEIIYWKDSARYYQNKLKEIQKILNKTLDK